MSSLILCSVLALVLAAFVIRPFWRVADKPYFSSDRSAHVFDESLALLESIQELEQDYKMGKISEGEYQSLANDFKREYLEVKHAGPRVSF
ncbi:MAG: hypothetical protein A2527_06645 [Candidatus Lambdaproteobacteria bacterium RIFOXYD2_FULL_50_16]|uniref:Uncharacterized protein n=1 Tax=Candidatus Lambdaproteobacteria bacterium RIFOXYD2_FULL_50_16 TaxID=1817772 RepID=A0A1F6GBN0_9PROT|nr:MAG: hypothetical protein A2527_06645 [Candidatus Lambdaproteobacteria bacterium RIFOXYD2_FULL_50_16]